VTSAGSSFPSRRRPPPDRRWLRRLAHPEGLPESERARIEQSLFSDAPAELGSYVVRLVALTALSALIASFGLLENSSAVVIGAMLVSPLMQPIIGLAAAIVGSEGRRQLVSIALIALATLESIGLAALVALVVPVFQAVTITPEIQLRTSPGILDLGIACAAGAAGAYVTVRQKAAIALPGAAIAVALMPPLAALGILLERGNGHLAGGAFLLFATNLFGIVLASALVLSTRHLKVQRTLTWRGRAAVLAPLAVAIAVAYPLGRHTTAAYRSEKDELLARSVLLSPLRAQGLGIQDLSIVEEPGQVVASVDVIGPQRAVGVSQLSVGLADRLHRPVTLILRWTRRTETTAVAAPSAG
jgi:uncharacterized hydrophobic protein (TIGR00271 family)